MTPFIKANDTSSERAERELAALSAAVRRGERPNVNALPVTVVHTESIAASHAIEELLTVNGISNRREQHAGDRRSFDVHPVAYADAKKALMANLAQLKERAPITDFCFYFNHSVLSAASNPAHRSTEAAA